MISKTLRHFNAIVTSAKLNGVDVDAAEIVPADLPNLKYVAEALIEQPTGDIPDPIDSVVFDGVPFRPITTINLLSAKVGTPCTIRVNLAVDPPAFLLYGLHEEFLFENCESQQAPAGVGRLTFTPGVLPSGAVGGI